MSNKTSFINKTVQIQAELSFAQMENLEHTLKRAYKESAGTNDINAMEVIAELGASLGVDAEVSTEEQLAELEAVE